MQIKLLAAEVVFICAQSCFLVCTASAVELMSDATVAEDCLRVVGTFG